MMGDFIRDSGVEKWVNIFGDVQLIERFDRLANKAERQMARGAISRALKPLVNEIRSRAPSRTGLLKRAIKSKVTKMVNGKVYVDPKVFTVSGTVIKFKFGNGLNAKEKRAKIHEWLQAQRDAGRRIIRPSRYATVVEFGRRAGFSERTRRKISASPARPFMRPAMDAARERVLSEIADEIRKNLAELRI